MWQRPFDLQAEPADGSPRHRAAGEQSRDLLFLRLRGRTLCGREHRAGRRQECRFGIGHEFLGAVLRIHDILVWIRIRIRGSMPLTSRSGCVSGSCYFHHWPSRRQQKTNFVKKFSAYYFLKVQLHHFSKILSQKKKSQNSRNQGFSYYFGLMMEGSGSVSIPLTIGSGSGSRRPKNMWIRIRIRNTAWDEGVWKCFSFLHFLVLWTSLFPDSCAIANLPLSLARW